MVFAVGLLMVLVGASGVRFWQSTRSSPANVEGCTRRWLIQALQRMLLGDNPIRAGVVETQGDQSAQVERGRSVMQPVVVPGYAAVAQSAVAASKPGDGAFDHGPMLAVVGQPIRVSRGLSGGA